MTEKVEKLARLSAAAFWRPEQLDRAFNSLPSDEIIMALPKKPIQKYLMLAKFTGDDAARYHAALCLHLKAVDLVNHRKWDVPRGSYIYKNLAAQAINELVDPLLCNDCQGRGEKFGKGGLIFTCNDCNGTGMGMMTMEKRWNIVGYGEYTEWKKKWQPRFDRIYSYGLDQLVSACYYFARKLDMAA